ncbi:nitrous oxide reductase family maturation protein NosD [Vibrio tapetis subsp. quintayensis]|uniref:nitrous oxide reductase family maturation protein NosD n=1 Tax=Vibrio tapetis TaxID=52443 RepID=UPI0025B3460C|nr:nitrous oxide reductase family maturation protein NosD [Vibrio tapetis]MDN3682457.1 nitrous oxide reductase family maturation protein NosD [Vibrio tapetis subsp. quintayensis]
MKQRNWLWLTLLSIFQSSVLATVITVTPQDDLQDMLDLSQPGDTIVIKGGEYVGNFTVNQSITLQGKQDATINANGKGNAITVFASDTVIENLHIINWGGDLTEQNAGIYNEKSLKNLTYRGNTFKGDAFGIWAQRVDRILVENNTIEGNPTLRSADRGNGIQLSSVKNALVVGNTVSKTRDGLYIISSQDSELRGNTMYDLRYGVHYMYSHHNRVIDNFAYNTRAGYALMSSRQLTVHGNRSLDSEDYGMLMNFITQSDISYNQIKNVWTKPENKVIGRDGKGLFVYNSGYNTISHNVIDTAEIGIHLTAGSENGKIFGNSFLNNPIQVKYVSNQKQEWSQNGVGNFWSNYLGWDLDNNSIGDTPFEPNDGIDKVVWKYPESKVLLDSPSVLMLRWIQKQFPVLKPPGVKDSHPLMMQPSIKHSQADSTGTRS